MNSNVLSRAAVATAAAAALVLAGAAVPASAATVPPPTRTITSAGNPIIADGSLYTADAAPLVGADGRLYIYTGHDEAAPQQAGFEMHDYAVLATDDVASGKWDVYEHNLDPDAVFSWASGNAAYAGQTVIGGDGRYYWYVPVESKDTTQANRMAIGVAVSDSPVGPWTDAIGKPLVQWSDVFGSSTNGQEVIDPHVFKDTDGTVYLYWGSWSVARVVKLTSSGTALNGPIATMSGLTSFYEAPWVLKKNGLYYLLYDWKAGGTDCTPSNYQACIGYATSTSPTGPWTYQGIILSGTSATTVHPSLIDFKGKSYLTYHTKDAVGGGHFRRSVAIDEAKWDGTKILPVKPTLAKDPRLTPSANLALDAQVKASFTEQPPMRTTAVNDGFRATTALLPPDQWGNYRGTTSSNETDWLSYQWTTPVRTGSVGIQFHQDSNWIRTPASWKLEYLDTTGDWRPVENATYPNTVNTWLTVSFTPVTTTALRATFAGRANGAYFHSVSVSEWEVYGRDAAVPAPIAVYTKPGVAPVLPAAVRITVDGAQQWAPVTWLPVKAADYANAGTFTTTGRALGVASALVQAAVTVTAGDPPAAPADNDAPTVTLSASGTSGSDGWFASNVTVRASAEDAVDYLTTVSTRVGAGAWTATPDVRFAEVTVAAEGTSTVTAKAQDSSGNASSEVSRIVKIDKTAPTATAALDAAARTVSITAADALSGVAAIEYRFDGTGAWKPATAGTAIAAPDGLPHQLTYRVRDTAGNTANGTVTVPKDDNAKLTGNVSSYATATASFTSGWENVNGLKDGTNAPFENAAGKYGASWGTWPQVGQQTATLTWSFSVDVDSVGVWWYRDSPDTANAGMIPPKSWVLQYLDGTTWRDVALDAGQSYGRTGTGFDRVDFAPVTTKSLRIVAQSWGAAEAGGSTGIREWQVIAAEAPAANPVIEVPSSALTVGTQFPVSVTGGAPSADYAVTLEPGAVALGTLHTDAAGAGSLTAALPADLAAGEYTVRAVRGDVVLEKKVMVALPALQVEASATPRCAVGKVHVVTVVKNTSDTPIQVEVSSPYGSKSFTAVQPGKSASIAFATRAASVAAGKVAVSFTAEDGRSGQAEAGFAAATCQ
ncbi:family 43 glycosylhydrolase [Microbacterium sp. B2969]|uniref:Family 43 glycosylhydrolase n=1 Tax=Microbacterium alkaliflavum TaxID=3248839 RepID=A0ABW7QEA6_9MICO